jgi:transporter family protein
MSLSLSILFAFSSMLTFGVGDFMAKTILSKAGAFRTLAVSQSIGCVLYLGVAVAFDLAVPDASLVLLAVLSGGLTTVNSLAFYKALSLGKASLVSPVNSCIIVVAIILSFLILGEKLSWLQISAITLVFAGILLAAFQKPVSRPGESNLSLLFALLAVFVGGCNVIVQKLMATNGHYLMGFLLSRMFMLSFLVILFPLLSIKAVVVKSPVRMYRKMALLGVIEGFALVAWFIGLRGGLVSIVTPIANSSPAVTIILAYCFLNERVLLHQRVGVFAILLGVASLSMIS